MGNKNPASRKCTTNVSLPYDMIVEMDTIAYLEKIPKAQMIREGLQMWLDKHEAEKTA